MSASYKLFYKKKVKLTRIYFCLPPPKECSRRLLTVELFQTFDKKHTLRAENLFLDASFNRLEWLSSCEHACVHMLAAWEDVCSLRSLASRFV